MDYQQNDSSSEAISLERALLRILQDNKYADVVLRSGIDGVQVHANRSLLGARSRVFDSMFYGEFKESNKDDAKMVVDLSFHGEVIRTVVEWIVTDTIRSWEGWKNDESKVGNEEARLIVHVASAADYFELPKLGDEAGELAFCIMERSASSSCVFLDEAVKLGRSVTSCTILSRALHVIRTCPTEALDPSDKNQTIFPGASAITNQSALEMIVSDEYTIADELTLFRAVRSWAESSDPGNITDIARDFVEAHIDISNIPASAIVDEVEESGLVSPEKLSEAYRKKAVRDGAADKLRKVTSRVHWEASFDRTVKGITSDWRVGGSQVTFLLNCGALRGSVHIWSIEVVKPCQFIWLGVADTQRDINRNQFLGDQEGGWVVGNNGLPTTTTHTCHNKVSSDVSFSSLTSGSIVYLALDLDAGRLVLFHRQQRLTLTAFDNMLEDWSGGKFVPAVSLIEPGEVRFLGFYSDFPCEGLQPILAGDKTEA